MANEAWTVRTPSEGPGKAAVFAGVVVVLLLVAGAVFVTQIKQEAPPPPAQTVREAALPTTEVKADHPADEPEHKTASFAAPIASKPKIDPATEDANAPNHWKKAVNLLALIQPGNDVVQGAWASKDGALVSDGSATARIGIPAKAPEEYDLKVTFTRTSGNEAVILVMGRPDRSFSWLLGGWNNTLFGFEMIGGQRANENRSMVKRDPALQNGKICTAIVRVRRDHLQAYLDGQLVTDLPMNFSEVNQADYWRLKDQHGFGLGSHQSPTQFHSVEMLDVTRPGAPVAISTPAPDTATKKEPETEF